MSAKYTRNTRERSRESCETPSAKLAKSRETAREIARNSRETVRIEGSGGCGAVGAVFTLRYVGRVWCACGGYTRRASACGRALGRAKRCSEAETRRVRSRGRRNGQDCQGTV
eukprot:371043-Prymnesium_polylepis.1